MRTTVLLVATALFMRAASAVVAVSSYSSGEKACSSCEKGERGDRGYRGWSFRGPKGDPGMCAAKCLNAADINLCQQLTLRLSEEDYEAATDFSSTSYKRSASFVPVPTGRYFTIGILNELRSGVLTIDELSRVQALDMLNNFCISMSSAAGQWPGFTDDEIQAEKGEKGEKGSPGVGATGPEGPPGEDGSKGEKGETGVGAEGPKGMKGCKGDSGDVGPVGNTGDPGPAGSTGPMGPKGDPGNVGQKGNSGLVYIHWGAASCPGGTHPLHYGLSMWSNNKYNELLCIETHLKPSAVLHNVQSTYTMLPVIFPNLYDNYEYLLCAQCSSDHKVSVYTVYGGEKCPAGWVEDYIGFAASAPTSDIVCLDQQTAVGINWGSHLSNDLKPVKTQGFNTHDHLPCVVCTK